MAINFEGELPIQLPLTQTTSADAVGDVVMLTLYALIPERGSTPVPILTPMAWKTASALAQQLGRAAAAAELTSVRKS